jgi:stage II sporulation protein D
MLKHSAITLAAALLLSACVGIRPQPEPQPAAVRPAPGLAAALRAYCEGSMETALSQLEELARRDPADPDSRRELVELYQEAGEYGRAIELLGELHLLDPRDASIEQALFVSLCLSGRGREARALLPLSNETAETVFHEARLDMQTGQPDHAALLFRKSLILDERQAWAWFFLGRLESAAGNHRQAETSFAAAMRLDANTTAALFPLAESVLAQGRAEDAYGLFRRARSVQPDHPGIAARLQELRTAHPEFERKTSEETRARKDRAEPPRVTASPQPASIPTVRVGLAEELGGLSLKTGADYSLRSPPGQAQPAWKGGKAELLAISCASGAITVSDAAGRQLISSAGTVVLEYEDPAASTLVFDFQSEAGSFYALSEDRAYRGRIEFLPRPEGLTLVNMVNLEEYLYAVIPSEIPASWPREALKAQAVAARSYTLAALGSYAAQGFDVYGSVRSAAYRGVLGENGKTSEAVDATRGLAVSIAGKPVKTYYSANSGGYTEDSRSVWNVAEPMRAVPDRLVPWRPDFLPPSGLSTWLKTRPAAYAGQPPFANPAAYRWQHWVAQADLAAGLRRDKDIGAVLSVVTRGRGISGRVREVEITGAKGILRVSADRVRSRLGGLRSNLFTVRPVFGAERIPEYFIFTGGGWGHGVGMCQTGAAGMAAAGFDAHEILRHYYPLAAPEKAY